MSNDTAETKSAKWDGFHLVIILTIVSIVHLLRLPDAASCYITTGYALVVVFLDRKASIRRIIGFLALAIGAVLLKMLFTKFGW